MTQKQLAEKVAGKAGVTKKQAETAATTMPEAILEALRENEKVALPGFSTFENRERGTHTGRNLATGETIQIPTRRLPVFQPGGKMQAAHGTQRQELLQEPMTSKRLSHMVETQPHYFFDAYRHGSCLVIFGSLFKVRRSSRTLYSTRGSV